MLIQIGFYNPHSHTHLQTKAVYNPIRSLTSSATINEKDLFVRSRKVSKPLNCRIALKFDRHIDSTAAEVPVKFQSDRTILNTNIAASRLYEILRKDVFSDIETGPRYPGSVSFPITVPDLFTANVVLQCLGTG